MSSEDDIRRLFGCSRQSTSPTYCVYLRAEKTSPLLHEVYRRIRQVNVDVVLPDSSVVTPLDVLRAVPSATVSKGSAALDRYDTTFSLTIDEAFTKEDLDALLLDAATVEACLAVVRQSEFNFVCHERLDKSRLWDCPAYVCTRDVRVGKVPPKVLLKPIQNNPSKRRLDLLSRISSYKSDREVVIDNGLDRSEVVLSVIVPVYNRERYVIDALKSVVDSEFSRSYELVVVNDASTDSTEELCRDFIGRINVPAKIVNKHTNTYVSHTRNVGVNHARGDLLFFLDSDNFITPQCLQRHCDEIERTGAAVCYAPIQCFEDDRGKMKMLRVVSNDVFDLPRMVQGNYIDTMAMLRKRDLIDVGGYSTWILHFGLGHEDYELWLRMHAAGKKFVLSRGECMSYYRVHEECLTNECFREGNSVEKLMMRNYS